MIINQNQAPHHYLFPSPLPDLFFPFLHHKAAIIPRHITPPHSSAYKKPRTPAYQLPLAVSQTSPFASPQQTSARHPSVATLLSTKQNPSPKDTPRNSSLCQSKISRPTVRSLDSLLYQRSPFGHASMQCRRVGLTGPTNKAIPQCTSLGARFPLRTSR